MHTLTLFVVLLWIVASQQSREIQYPWVTSLEPFYFMGKYSNFVLELC